MLGHAINIYFIHAQIQHRYICVCHTQTRIHKLWRKRARIRCQKVLQAASGTPSWPEQRQDCIIYSEYVYGCFAVSSLSYYFNSLADIGVLFDCIFMTSSGVRCWGAIVVASVHLSCLWDRLSAGKAHNREPTSNTVRHLPTKKTMHQCSMPRTSKCIDMNVNATKQSACSLAGCCARTSRFVVY